MSNSITPTSSAEKITFKSGNNSLKGLLFRPEPNNTSCPAITFIGPVGYVKEQAPLEYARRLIKKGYVTLVFDPTGYGESDGQPRQYENGDYKARDIVASIDYLSQLDGVDNTQIYGVGICQGINWMIAAANLDSRLRSLSLVAGHYLTPEVALMYSGGDHEALQNRLERARASKERYEKTGEVDYIPIVSLDNPDALLKPKPVYDWYMPWEKNKDGRGGHWKNKITRMSELMIWGSDIEIELKKLQQPTLMIHANRAASGPDIPKKLFKSISAADKKMAWFEDQMQTQFYDDPRVINRAVDEIHEWFSIKAC